MYAARDLLRRMGLNIREVQCNCSYEMLDVRSLLDGVGPDGPAKQPDWASKPPAPRTVRIFLASANELTSDRDAFELHFRRENDRYQATGQYLEIVRWENFLAAVSHTRKQDDYNLVIKECDIFVSLFATKAGKFTEEEFDTAYAQFKSDGVPTIFTFFKDVQVSTGSLRREDMESLWAMQKKLDGLGHIYTNYANTADLNLRFTQQLQKMPDKGMLK